MKLYHPTLADNVVEVTDSEADDWTEQGWRKTDPHLVVTDEGVERAPRKPAKSG